MMHNAWCSIEEVPYCFPRSSIKFQVHTGQNIVNLDPNLGFPDCHSNLNSPMDLKWCTKLDLVWKNCPIVFRGHPSNFKVTRAEKSMIWIPIWEFYVGRSYQIPQICLVFSTLATSNNPSFLYARLKNGRIMPWQCQSVRPSIRVFRTFFQHALRYQFETWYMHSVGGTTCGVWVSSQLGHFHLVYSQK